MGVMAWEDHPELVNAPGDGYDPRTEHEDWESWAQSGPYTHDTWRHTNNPCALWPHDTEHERNEDMGEMAEWFQMQDEARAIDRMTRRLEGSGRPPRRPILPLEVALAKMTAPPGAERFGSEPPVGSVLRWEATGTYGRGVGKTLTYLGIRTPKGWWTTHDAHTGASTWAQMVHWIGDGPCSVATGWTEIPAPEPEPQGDDVVAAWASQFRRAEPVTRHLGDADGGVEDDREPRFDAEGRDRNGWTRAELGEDDDWSADANDVVKGPGGDGH